MKTIPLKHSLIAALCGFSYTAAAQVNSYRSAPARANKVTLELKPLSAALSTTPGVGSAGIGGELALNENMTSFADVYAINANLPSRLRGESREDDVPVVQKMQGYSADLGARYYGQPLGDDSWYGGVRLSYGYAKGQWGYQGEKIDQSVRTLSPGIEAGYRWIWTNNLLLRLGAGADSNLIQQNDAAGVERENAATIAAEEKVKGYAKVAVTPRGDMGLGYAF